MQNMKPDNCDEYPHECYNKKTLLFAKLQEYIDMLKTLEKPINIPIQSPGGKKYRTKKYRTKKYNKK